MLTIIIVALLAVMLGIAIGVALCVMILTRIVSSLARQSERNKVARFILVLLLRGVEVEYDDWANRRRAVRPRVRA